MAVDGEVAQYDRDGTCTVHIPQSVSLIFDAALLSSIEFSERVQTLPFRQDMKIRRYRTQYPVGTVPFTHRQRAASPVC